MQSRSSDPKWVLSSEFRTRVFRTAGFFQSVSRGFTVNAGNSSVAHVNALGPSSDTGTRVFRTAVDLQPHRTIGGLKVSLNLKLKSARPSPVWGGSELRKPNDWDRCRPFVRAKSNLNTKSPPGGGSKLSMWKAAGPAPLSCADFFSAQRVSRRLTRDRAPNSLVTSRARGRARDRNSDLFSQCPRGASKVWRLSIADRWASDKQNVANLRKHFFGAAATIQKIAAKFRWGGR
jgi:hypothetical protein